MKRVLRQESKPTKQKLSLTRIESNEQGSKNTLPQRKFVGFGHVSHAFALMVFGMGMLGLGLVFGNTIGYSSQPAQPGYLPLVGGTGIRFQKVRPVVDRGSLIPAPEDRGVQEISETEVETVATAVDSQTTNANAEVATTAPSAEPKPKGTSTDDQLSDYYGNIQDVEQVLEALRDAERRQSSELPRVLPFELPFQNAPMPETNRSRAVFEKVP